MASNIYADDANNRGIVSGTRNTKTVAMRII